MITREEASKIAYTLSAAYPAAYKNMNAKMAESVLRVWEHTLADYTYSEASAALDAFMARDTKGFPPSPGQVIDIIHHLTDEPDNSALEAWSMVRRAIRNSSYFANEEYSKLPKAIQKAIGSPANLKEMARMDENTVESVEQSHFIKAYNAEIANEKADRKIPKRVVSIMDSKRKSLERQNAKLEANNEQSSYEARS